MAITSLGVGSGMDLNGLLTSLMQAEQRPLVALQTKEASYQSRISSLGVLKGSLSSLQTAAKNFIPSTGQTAADKFATLKSSVGDSSILTASTTSSAVAASYTLSNVKLAQAEQIRAAATSFTVPATDGTLSIQLGSGTAVDVSVTGGASLSDIATAINSASAGVTAAVVNDGSIDHLVITSNKSGTSNQITITASDVGATGAWDSFNYTPRGALPLTDPYDNNGWTEQQAAKSASVTLNGIQITSETNSISSAITGVSLTLLKESTTGTSLSVSKETSSNLSAALTGFVKAYNDSASVMKGLGAYDPKTKAAGALQGDSSLRNTQSQVRSWMFSPLGGSGAYQTLSDIGVSIEKDGTLKLDSTKMNKAIEADFTGVANLVASVGTVFKDGLEGIVGTTGRIKAATDNTALMITSIQKRQTAMFERLIKIEERYTKQFSSLDTLVANMNQTSTYLTQQLANLPGAYSGN